MGNVNSIPGRIRGNLENQQGELARAARVTGNKLARFEKGIAEAFSLDSSSTQDDINKVAAKYGVISKDKIGTAKISAEGLQLAIKQKLEKASRAYSMLEKVFTKMNQVMMQVINSIR